MGCPELKRLRDANGMRGLLLLRHCLHWNYLAQGGRTQSHIDSDRLASHRKLTKWNECEFHADRIDDYCSFDLLGEGVYRLVIRRAHAIWSE